MSGNEEILKGGFKELEEKKEIPIEWEGVKDAIVLRKLTAGDVSEIRRQSIKFKTVGKETIVDSNMELLKQMAIIKSVEKAPFKVGIEDVMRLPPKFYDSLYEEVEKFNELGVEKKES